MATTSKAAYTPEQTKELLELWDNGNGGYSIQDLALKLNRQIKSIATKLSREGCYKSPAKTAKPSIKKDNLANDIAKKCGLDEVEADSITKSNRTALAKILLTLNNGVVSTPKIENSEKINENNGLVISNRAESGSTCENPNKIKGLREIHKD